MKAIYSLILGLSILTAYPLQASEESHQEAAKQMVEVANLDKMLNAMYQQINMVITENLLKKDPCLEPIRGQLNDLLAKYDQKILNADSVKAEIQKVYQTEFTEDEIKQIVAFYKTPAGKKALEKAPVLAAKGMEIAQKEIDKNKNLGVMDDLQKDINALINNIDVKTLSPECKKKFEDRKLKAQSEAKTDENAKAGMGAAGAATAGAVGAAAGTAAAAGGAGSDKSAATEAKAENKPESKSDVKAKPKAKAKTDTKAKADAKSKKNTKKKTKEKKDS